jgi:hypothetical protein
MVYGSGVHQGWWAGMGASSAHQHVRAVDARNRPCAVSADGSHKGVSVKIHRIIRRALVAATCLLVWCAAASAVLFSPAQASSLSRGGVAVESLPSPSPSAPVRYELHFRNLYPESSVYLAIAIRDTNCDHYGGLVSIGWWKLDYNVDRLVSSGELTDDVLYYARSADGKVLWTSEYNKIWINENAPFRICRGAPGSVTWKTVGTLWAIMDSQHPVHRIDLTP